MLDEEFDDLMTLADLIGTKVANGQLPPQDDNGFYILTPDTAVAAL